MLRFRIPAWANGATAYVNGKRLTSPVHAGSFLTVHRQWKTGDRVELDLPMSMRLEAIDPQHPDTVALLCGPVVLFPTGSAIPALTREQLLAAKRVQPQRWQVETGSASLEMAPFTAIDHEPYSTYLNLS